MKKQLAIAGLIASLIAGGYAYVKGVEPCRVGFVEIATQTETLCVEAKYQKYFDGIKGTQVETLIKNKTSDEKHLYKTASLIENSTKTFVKDGITVTVEQIGFDKDGLLTVVATAKRGVVDLKVDNPLRFKNPPILVNDPNGTIVRTSTDTDGKVTTRKLREDPSAVLQEIIIQTIKLQNP